jgi:hypothetical protein
VITAVAFTDLDDGEAVTELGARICQNRSSPCDHAARCLSGSGAGATEPRGTKLGLTVTRVVTQRAQTASLSRSGAVTQTAHLLFDAENLGSCSALQPAFDARAERCIGLLIPIE